MSMNGTLFLIMDALVFQIIECLTVIVRTLVPHRRSFIPHSLKFNGSKDVLIG